MWLLLTGCTHDDQPKPGHGPDLDWGDPVTTLTRRIVADPVLPALFETDPALPDGLAAAEAAGLGAYTEQDGEPHLVREDLVARGAQADRRSIAFVLHQSDAQIADTESPTRVMALDLPGATESAARPQELYAVHALDALIRTADALSVDHPIDFAVITGDNADSAQGNETDWFISVMDGRELRADSGDPNAQPDGDGNDPIASFTPVGATFPWYTVAGNHDTLVQGNFSIDTFATDVLGRAASGGTRDLSQPGGPIAFTTQSADPERALLDRSSLVERYLASTTEPTGHGFTPQNATDGTATWSASPVPGVRLLGLDTNPPDARSGYLPADERDTFLIPALEAAKKAGELVIVTSHYPLGPLEIEGGGTLGDLLDQYPNVVLSLVGHTHKNRVVPYPSADGHGFWEIETCATADWPGEARLVELVDNGDGTLSIYGTMVDNLAPDGTLSARSRKLTLIDWESGWRVDDGVGTAQDRNVELLVPVPPGATPHGSRARVESLVLP